MVLWRLEDGDDDYVSSFGVQVVSLGTVILFSDTPNEASNIYMNLLISFLVCNAHLYKVILVHQIPS